MRSKQPGVKLKVAALGRFRGVVVMILRVSEFISAGEVEFGCTVGERLDSAKQIALVHPMRMNRAESCRRD